jgi:glycyl-tRNA synthetase beta chain
MPADLLFEIGCEEIPARMLTRALAELPALAEKRLADARLAHGGCRAIGTPRRIALVVKQLVERQPDLNEEVVGPPASAAFAPDGSLTKAGQGWAAKSGVDQSSIAKKEWPGKKGLYAVGTRHVAGEDTRALLPALLRELAGAIAWPKSMRWGWTETAFVRPVQWLVALYGVGVVALEWAGQTAGRASRGHRFLSPGAVEIASASDYESALRHAHVVVDPAKREELVRGELLRLAGETKLAVRPDDALVAEVANLGEYPRGVAGGFDASYLAVPEEIIVTAMRTHQRYFALADARGALAPKFATMMATIVTDDAVVARGNERVLAARLADAKFFFETDKTRSFDEWNAQLDGVVFQAKLGDKAKTIGDKVRRLVEIVRALDGSPTALRAAQLCKADLASHVVGEFPELQGVMGRHYARIAGEPDAVARAIEEHWWPKGQGGALPASDDAALVAIADRMDTIVGCFAVGLEPTGSADPLGLRRAAIGFWQILLERGWTDVGQRCFRAAADALARHGVATDKLDHIQDFFIARLRGIFLDLSIPPQEADAALAVSWADPIDARARAAALAAVPQQAREVFKRIANILDDARAKKYEVPSRVDAALFTSDAERNLWRAFGAQQIAGSYPDRIEVLVKIQGEVAAFFDRGGVMVMDPDPQLRGNRLAILNAIYEPFARIGDFRKLGGAS